MLLLRLIFVAFVVSCVTVEPPRRLNRVQNLRLFARQETESEFQGYNYPKPVSNYGAPSQGDGITEAPFEEPLSEDVDPQQLKLIALKKPQKQKLQSIVQIQSQPTYQPIHYIEYPTSTIFQQPQFVYVF
jgi:hypothetical protein